MTPRKPFRWPPEREALLRRAMRLEIATLFFMGTILAVMYYAMGNSQAMKTAWIEDLLGVVPAIAFIGARHFEKRPPDRQFPFGYHRAISIAYLIAATAVMLLSIYMIYDSGLSLYRLERPTIGVHEIAGYEFWMGWLMIAALTYSIIPPFILGRLKTPVAHGLHDKVLLADAAMQRADWLTAAAAIVGIIGVGFGFWWADAVAAIVIALDVMNDGRKHLGKAVADLAGHEPRSVEGDSPDPAVEAVREAVLALDWVADAELQLRAEGHLLSGTVILRTREPRVRPEWTEEAQNAAQAAHWRVYDPTVSVLPAHEAPPGASSRD